MKRLVAVIGALLLGATFAAAPAFADDAVSTDPSCYKVSGADYTQVVCEDAVGDRVSVTTYFNDGCVTTVDASGESSTCVKDDPVIDGSNEIYTNDAACDVEVLADADGNDYKLMTCRNADGTVAWQARYTQDGCVTQVDADGSEFTSCPEVQPWLPPVAEVLCESEPWTDAAGVEYKLVTCRDADGNVVSQTRYSQDGCVTRTDADGNETTSCSTPECTTSVDSDGNEVTSCSNINIPQWYPISDYRAIVSVKKADDGCWTIGKSDGSTALACPDSTPVDGYTSGPLTLDDRGCIIQTGPEGGAWGVDCPGACYFVNGSVDDQSAQVATCFGGNTPEDMTKRSLAFCDVQLLQVDSQPLTIGVCDDGCTLVNGMPSQECSQGWLYSWALGERTTLWVTGSYSQDRAEAMTCWTKSEDGSWVSNECPTTVMDDKVFTTADSGVIQRRNAVDALATMTMPMESLEGETFALGATEASDAAQAGAVDSAAAEQTVKVEAMPEALGISLATARTSSADAPVSAAAAAAALACVGTAGLATTRLRLQRRRR